MKSDRVETDVGDYMVWAFTPCQTYCGLGNGSVVSDSKDVLDQFLRGILTHPDIHTLCVCVSVCVRARVHVRVCRYVHERVLTSPYSIRKMPYRVILSAVNIRMSGATLSLPPSHSTTSCNDSVCHSNTQIMPTRYKTTASQQSLLDIHGYPR